MGLVDDFQEILDALPSDWTDLELDLRVDESQYLEAATFMVTCNAQPYSNHDWHWRLLVAHQFGHAAAVPAVQAMITREEGLDRQTLSDQFSAVEAAFTAGVPVFGYLDEARLQAWARWDARVGILKTPPDVARAFDTTLVGPASRD